MAIAVACLDILTSPNVKRVGTSRSNVRLEPTAPSMRQFRFFRVISQSPWLAAEWIFVDKLGTFTFPRHSWARVVVFHFPIFYILLNALGHEKIEGLYLSHPSNIIQDTNCKLINQRLMLCVSGMLEAIRDNRDSCDVRKQVIQLVIIIKIIIIIIRTVSIHGQVPLIHCWSAGKFSLVTRPVDQPVSPTGVDGQARPPSPPPYGGATGLSEEGWYPSKQDLDVMGVFVIHDQNAGLKCEVFQQNCRLFSSKMKIEFCVSVDSARNYLQNGVWYVMMS